MSISGSEPLAEPDVPREERKIVSTKKESTKRKTSTAVDDLTAEEREAVTIVFHQFETGLREGTIFTKDALDAMKALGLNPGEQEMIDMTNEVNVNGLIYYPDFCKIVLRKYREENREVLNQALFKVICGTDPYPKNFRAKKYKIKEKFFTKADFQLMMRNLPVPVNEDEINEMFDFADKDKDGKINYSEFETMINPKVYKPPPKFSFRNLKKYMPQIKEMAKREGLAIKKEEKAGGGKTPVKADTVLKFLKDD